MLGVLAGNLDLGKMNEIVSRRTGLRQSDDAFLVNTSELFVTQPRFINDPAVLRLGVHTEAVKHCLERRSGVIIKQRLSRHARDCRLPLAAGTPVVFDRQNGPGRGSRPGNQSWSKYLGDQFAGTVGCGSAGVDGCRAAITRPIHQLAKGAAEIGGGNLAYRIASHNKDEIGHLATEFNHMAGSIENMQAQLGQRAIQLEAANQELEAFSYSISHDLRAPLRAMDGFSRILLEEYAPQLPAEAQRYLGLVRDNAQQMGHLIEDLLAFSRLSRQPLNKQTVAPAELVRQVLAELRAEQEGRKVEVTIGDLPACEADPALLKQVWVNLLSNALKFTRKREDAQHRNRCPSQIRQPECIYFVKDNGVGFDMQYANKLFGVFQRLHRAEEYEGTGVGLAIVQRIVHRHGGRIWAEAEVDKGATFYFTLEGGT